MPDKLIHARCDNMIRALKEWKQDCQDVIDLGKEFYTHERLQLEAKNITRIDEILKGENEE